MARRESWDTGREKNEDIEGERMEEDRKEVAVAYREVRKRLSERASHQLRAHREVSPQEVFPAEERSRRRIRE